MNTRRENIQLLTKRNEFHSSEKQNVTMQTIRIKIENSYFNFVRWKKNTHITKYDFVI